MAFPNTPTLTPVLQQPTALGEVHTWTKKLDAMRVLKTGWNGYEAEPPSELAIETANRFLGVLESEGLMPTRVAPSVVGGVGITRKVGERRVYVEFYNDGAVHAMFAEGEKAETAPILASIEGFKAVVSRARGYLNA